MREGTPAPNGLLQIGVVVRAHGVDGAVKLRLHDPQSAAPEQVPAAAWRLSQGGRLLAGVELRGRSGDTLVLGVPRVSDRAAAEALRGALLYVPRAALALEVDEYLYADLIGCRVCEGERCFGTVAEVFSAGASDVLVVRDTACERLIPLVEQWVASVDLGARRIEIVDGESWDPQPLG